MQLTCNIFVILLSIAGSQAAVLTHVPTTVYHGDSTAVSHQSFTRLPHTKTLTPSYAIAPVATARHTHNMAQPSVSYVAPTVTVQRQPIFQQQQQQIIPGHTPAQLTYAAAPVVHQMLPMIKPVRKISYAELSPGPRQLTYQH